MYPQNHQWQIDILHLSQKKWNFFGNEVWVQSLAKAKTQVLLWTRLVPLYFLKHKTTLQMEHFGNCNHRLLSELFGVWQAATEKRNMNHLSQSHNSKKGNNYNLAFVEMQWQWCCVIWLQKKKHFIHCMSLAWDELPKNRFLLGFSNCGSRTTCLLCFPQKWQQILTLSPFSPPETK